MGALLLSKPAMYVAAALALMGALAYAHHTIYAQGAADKERELTAAYAARDKKAQALADARIAELTAQAAAEKAQHVAAQDAITNRLKGVQIAYEKTKADVAARVAAGYRLRDSYASSTAASCIGGVPDAAASTAGNNATGGGELSEQLTGFLLSEAERADKVAQQLQACQAVVLSDRAVKP